jgi:hypothetical protein
MSKSPALERCAYAVFILTCILLATLATRRYFVDTHEPRAREGPGVGTLVTSRDAVGIGKADFVVLLGISTQCRFCEDSVPFYQTLRRTASQSRKRVVLVCASSEPTERVRGFLERNGLRPDAIIVPPQDVPLLATPTLTLIDSSGKIVAAWVGRLSPAQERKVLSLIP